MDFTNCVVPLSLSDLSTEKPSPVYYAMNLVQPGGKIHFYHCVNKIAYMEGDAETDAFLARVSGEAQQKLTNLIDQIRTNAPKDVELVASCGSGLNIAAEILKYCKEVGADVIAMQSHKFDPLQPEEHHIERFASVSHKVAILAHCPVFLSKIDRK